jgi:hypothetical protein
MSYWHEASDHRRDGVTIPHIGVAVALSILLHAVVLWQTNFSLRAPGPDDSATPRLTVRLEQLPGPPPTEGAAPPVLLPPRAPRDAPAQAAPRAPPPQPQGAPLPVIARDPPPKTPADTSAAAPVRAPPASDFAAFVEAQRRARGEPAEAAPAAPPASEDANARATRQAIANLAIPRTPAFGHDPSRSGGVFHLRSKSIDYAEFMFNGWHSEARRNWAQLVEVRKGNHASIELAVVRQMIDIIRKYEQGDFPWYSHRMNRTVTLSARPRDTQGLEEFLIREFFYNPRIAP